MRKTIISLGLLTTCLSLLALNSGNSADNGPSEEKAVREAAASYGKAFNAGDLEALAALWAPDAEYIDEAGKVTKGREAIAALFKQYIAGLKGSKMTLKVGNIRLLKGDVALLDGSSSLTGPDGVVDDGKFTSIWSKDNGKWVLRSARDLPNEAGKGPGTNGALSEIQWLVGVWETENGKIRVTVRPALNKAFLLMDYKTKQGESELEVRQLMGYDPLSGQIKSWTFDSFGGYGEGLWTRDGNSWVIETVGVLSDGAAASGVNVIRYVDDQSFIFQSRDRQIGNQPIADSEAKLVRKQAAQ